MNDGHLVVKQSPQLQGAVELSGAKNAVLVIMTSLLLTNGKSRLRNVPCSADVLLMIELLEYLGAVVFFDNKNKVLDVDTSLVAKWTVSPSIMKKMRASILVMGPLLARFGKVQVALPGGDAIGTRPIDYHLKNFARMGARIHVDGEFITAESTELSAQRIVFEYPSVGATENILLASVLTRGITYIINAAIEPEVLDLIVVLKKMGAIISIESAATLVVEGVNELYAVDHEIMMDRMEAGSLLIAAAATGGTITVPTAQAHMLDLFLYKLEEMGHKIVVGAQGVGITLHATQSPRAVSFKTGPYPGFPTDLQPPMMALQTIAMGTSIIEETVFENRFHHVHELQKMGACIKIEHNKAIVTGVEQLYGVPVIASDIRAAMALVVAGLVSEGVTTISGVYHWKRGYDAMETKLALLGANIMLDEFVADKGIIPHTPGAAQKHPH